MSLYTLTGLQFTQNRVVEILYLLQTSLMKYSALKFPENRVQYFLHAYIFPLELVYYATMLYLVSRVERVNVALLTLSHSCMCHELKNFN